MFRKRNRKRCNTKLSLAFGALTKTKRNQIDKITFAGSSITLVMTINPSKHRITTSGFWITLLLLAVVVGSLVWFAYCSDSTFQFVSYVVIALLPLAVALGFLVRGSFKFSIRTMFVTVTLVAVFVAVSLVPLVRHRSARNTSMRFMAASATLNASKDWNVFYAQVGLELSPEIAIEAPSAVPPWLAPFTASTDDIPLDSSIRSIWLDNDTQCQILAENWKKLPALRSVGIAQGVTSKGLDLLQDVLPRIEHLEMVQTTDITVPRGWYRKLTNIRMLWVWGEFTSRGMQFNDHHVKDISELSNLQAFMVLGYAFDDNDAQVLSTSNSIKRVILRGTNVTSTGEAALAGEDRVVYRN